MKRVTLEKTIILLAIAVMVSLTYIIMNNNGQLK